MRQFDHVGMPTEEKQPNEIHVKTTKVWVTNQYEHPLRIEYLRFEPDSPVTGPVRDCIHMAFRVDDLDAELEGEEVLLGPFSPRQGLRVVFIRKDGAVFEFMEGAVEGKKV